LEWKTRAAQKEHRHVNDLDENVRFLRGVHDGGDDQTEGAKGGDPETNKDNERKPVWGIRHPENVVRQEQHQSDSGNIEDHSHRDRRAQKRDRGDGGHLVTAQNIFFPFLDRSHSGAEKTGSQNSDRRHHRDDQQNSASVLAKGKAEGEKENQGKEVIKEEDSPIPPGELQIDLEEGEKGFHLFNPEASFP
jgi:hypothetical protein